MSEHYFFNSDDPHNLPFVDIPNEVSLANLDLGVEHQYFFMPPRREWTWREKLMLVFLPLQEERSHEDPLRPDVVTITQFKIWRGMIYVMKQWHEPAYSGTISEEQFSGWIEEIRPTMRAISHFEDGKGVRTYRMHDGKVTDEEIT